MTKYRYVRAVGVRKLVKTYDKRCGADFLHELDCLVHETVCRCCKQWNGSKKTLDRIVVKFVTGGIKT